MRRLALLVLLGGCPDPKVATVADAAAAAVADAAEVAVADAAAAADAGAEPAITAEAAERSLFPGSSSGCPTGDTEDGRIRCMLAKRYASDKTAMATAVDLYRDTGDLVGLEPEQTMNGGFRGMIHIVPEPPIGEHEKHLEWVAGGMRDFDKLFAGLRAARPTASPSYRWRAITFRFFRSVGRTTPSAYADGWTVAYNVSGSLLKSADGVRETLFHELFHSNDHAHGDWSYKELHAIFDPIAKKCGTNAGCLAPYAPTDTMVRGGTYYAFQPDNGDPVREYAAELGLRWYKEQRAVLAGEKLGRKPFKCGPPENAKSWSMMIAEFYGGIDLTGGC